MEDIYEKLIVEFGKVPQIHQTMEELAECIVALNKYFFRKTINEEALISEIADVEIMMKQLRCIIKKDKEIDDMKLFKLERVKERLNRKVGNKNGIDT